MLKRSFAVAQDDKIEVKAFEGRCSAQSTICNLQSTIFRGSHMHEEQRQRAQTYLKAQGLDRALFASPASVTWLTGFAAPVQLGPHPFGGGPALAWYAGGEWTLIVLDSYAAS